MGRLAVSGKVTTTRAYRTNSAGEHSVTVVAGKKTSSGKLTITFNGSGTVVAANSSATITIARWRNRVIGGP